MTVNSVLDTIYNRKSVRSFNEDSIPDAEIEELIRAGFHAANGMNAQALRFSVVSDRSKLREYLDRAKPLFLKNLREAGMSNDKIERMLGGELCIFSNAPVVIFIFADMSSAATPVEDASLAAGNIMLAARSMGLGTCWIGFASPLDADLKFREDNNVPDTCRLLASVTVGHPTADRDPTPRIEPPVLAWLR
jgi:nitroreductase